MGVAEEDAELVHRIWRVHRTYLKMLRDRGYLVGDEELSVSLEEFKTKYGDSPSAGTPSRSSFSRLFELAADPAIRLYLYYVDPDPKSSKIGIKEIRSFIEETKSRGCKRAIMIVPMPLTPSAKKGLTEMASASKDSSTQIFEESQLVVNITDHILVPKHEVLTDDEKQALLERYKLKEHQLPRLKLTDPVSQYFGLKRSQVVFVWQPRFYFLFFRLIICCIRWSRLRAPAPRPADT
eukprot:m.21730 g.21730  ORF g.21730 m.21730 type:complete len:237 (+) comp33101_c0_seq2:117-827(+)